ncbi:MAG: pyruvate dehydrogenase complex dihydrolipoamide acetyltransferase [Proteobacteria bacterium]|nr:pyruvate dehydrogenase complex dihydrolipoamide acetyltransferase [Pseudomonadota bacterium]
MATPLFMPALSPTMTEGTLAKWLKKEGDQIKPGEVIAEIETDKATMEVEAADAGTLGTIVVSADSQGVKVGTLIAVILENGENKDAALAVINKHTSAPPANTTEQEAATLPVKPGMPPKALITPASDRILASPLARRVAATNNVRLETLTGTGPHGRIVKRDVEGQAGAVGPGTHMPVMNMPVMSVGRATPESTSLPTSTMRKVIGKRLLESKQTIPHFYLTVECNIDGLLEARTQINERAPVHDKQPAYKISVNDLVVKAVAMALRAMPKANCALVEDNMVQFHNVDVSVAMAIEDGLITPIIQNADQKSLLHISEEIKELNRRAKANSLKPHEFQGGSFTVTNLGMYGVKQFNAIINPPQACILAVGAAERKPVVCGDAIKIANILTITISCDHRVVDGAVAAEFMGVLKGFLEAPVTMLV